ncbi:MAG: transposase [Synergistaceae bacterium]|nr:transposase [Synergistaceae bacterium]
MKKYKSFSYNMVGKNIIIGNEIKIAGDYYKFFKSREIKGNVKLLTIKRDSLGDLYVYVVSDDSSDIVEARSVKIVGFDFGLKTFLTSSDGDHIESPLFFKRSSAIIKKRARNLSRKTSQSHHEHARL